MWVDDARLVVLNAMDARERGARIYTRTPCTQIRRNADHWIATLGGRHAGTVRARAVINAAGPWADRFLCEASPVRPRHAVRLVKGSHIIVPRLYEGEHAFILQNSDNRIVFVIPYEREFSLIGTTDVPVESEVDPVCTAEETAYLCELTSHYMAKPVRPQDVVWSFSGVRPLVHASCLPSGEKTGRPSKPSV